MQSRLNFKMCGNILNWVLRVPLHGYRQSGQTKSWIPILFACFTRKCFVMYGGGPGNTGKQKRTLASGMSTSQWRFAISVMRQTSKIDGRFYIRGGILQRAVLLGEGQLYQKCRCSCQVYWSIETSWRSWLCGAFKICKIVNFQTSKIALCIYLSGVKNYNFLKSSLPFWHLFIGCFYRGNKNHYFILLQLTLADQSYIYAGHLKLKFDTAILLA